MSVNRKVWEMCKYCRYWDCEGVHENTPYGGCYRFPPTALGVEVDGGATTKTLTGAWPSTPDTAWCGEGEFDVTGAFVVSLEEHVDLMSPLSVLEEFFHEAMNYHELFAIALQWGEDR